MVSQMVYYLALYNFGMFRVPSADPVNDGFHHRNDPIFVAVDGRAGFIARSGYDGEPGPESWGKQVFPRFYVDNGDGWAPSTLSLWEDMESLIAFTYSGLHAEAMRHAREWFEKPNWPPYVCWWQAEGERPTWAEAIIRHEHLHDHGPTPFAFDFKTPFDASGASVTLDRDKIKAIRQSFVAGREND